MNEPTAPFVQSALHVAGPQAARIEDLWWLMFWVCTVVYVLVLVPLLAAILRRRPPVVTPVPRPEPERERDIGRVVWSAVALTALTLFLMIAASYVIDKGLDALAHDEEVSIEVTARQWWWQVRYDGTPENRSFTTANEIHIPVGATVKLTLKSVDVIHSFWVPPLHGKLDHIPGQDNVLYLRADRPGTYRGQCAEFCGAQHAKMAFEVVAEDRESFTRWWDAQLAPAPQPADEAQERGLAVFLAGPCTMCHTIRGTNAGARSGPDLTHVGSRHTLAAGALPNGRGYLAAWIADPQGIKPGNHMPATNLEPQDFQALVSYLESLK
ncbi:MAG TPA: cytochrome c oxidase subunit II [Azospirillum sp.]|nr:cytochrome c oxidase subunit II [Azospirillum sp.]